MSFDDYVHSVETWLTQLEFTPVKIYSLDGWGGHMAKYRSYTAYAGDGRSCCSENYMYYAGESDGDDLNEIIRLYVLERFGLELSE